MVQWGQRGYVWVKAVQGQRMELKQGHRQRMCQDRDRFRDWDRYQDQSRSGNRSFLVPMNGPGPVISGPNDWSRSWFRFNFGPGTGPGFDPGPVA